MQKRTEFNQNTMLQKLTKCEVKAAQFFYNFVAFPPRYYVKSNFGEFKQSKNVISYNVKGSRF